MAEHTTTYADQAGRHRGRRGRGRDQDNGTRTAEDHRKHGEGDE